MLGDFDLGAPPSAKFPFSRGRIQQIVEEIKIQLNPTKFTSRWDTLYTDGTYLQSGEALQRGLDDLGRRGGSPDEERGLLVAASAAGPGSRLVGQPARGDGLRVVVVLATVTLVMVEALRYNLLQKKT